MTLLETIDAYVDWRRAHGAKFITSARVLHQFCAHVGGDRNCDAVSKAEVLGFLAGNRALTRTRAKRYGALAGFYRYAISRGHVVRSPLPTPDEEPREPRSAPPYVFSRDELQRLFEAVDTCQRRSTQLDAATLRMLLLLLYGAGLRFGEARRLTFDDVDLDDAVLTIRDSKFFKNRLVPVGMHLAEALRSHAATRRERPLPKGMASTFLANRDGTPLATSTVQRAFAKVIETAGIRHDTDDGRRPPCPHSLRHAAAVHRLEAWYRQGADVQRLLPALSTWLGHANLDGTRVYLSMTPELLHQASVRFERYVEGDNHE